MRRLGLLVLLGGCAAAVPTVEPCACVIMPDPNGAVSVTFDGTPLQLDGDDGGAYDTVPAFGAFGSSENGRGVVTVGFSIDAVTGLGISAEWAPGMGWDTGRAAAIVSLGFMPGLRADRDYGDDSFALGPQGGTLTLRQVEARDDGGWRLRGDYAAEVCPETGEAPCATLSGEFALTADSLPDR